MADEKIEELKKQNKILKDTLVKIINCYDLRTDLYSNEEVALSIIVDYARNGLRSISL